MARLEAITRWFQTPAPAPFDTDFVAFAESLELAMVGLYNETLLKLTGENVATAARFRDHHQEHAQAYASLAAGKAKGVPNSTLLFVKLPAIQAVVDEASALRSLVALEDQMAETYAYGLGLLTTPEIYRRVITTLPVECQHAAALGTKVPLTADEQFITGPFVNASVGDGSDPRRGFDMGTFPVG